MTGEKKWQFCPPSMDPKLWVRIPEDRKQDFFNRAARQLTRGFHPNITARDFLVELGILKPAPIIKPLAKGPPIFGKNPKSTSSKTEQSKFKAPVGKIGKGFKVAPSPSSIDVEEQFEFSDDMNTSVLPTFYFEEDGEKAKVEIQKLRLSQDARPNTSIGLAVHDLLGLPGEAGQKAAEVEASIMAAIASDPARVLADPLYVIKLGVSAPDYVVESITQLIADECKSILGIKNLDHDDHADEYETDNELSQYEYSDDDQWVDND